MRFKLSQNVFKLVIQVNLITNRRQHVVVNDVRHAIFELFDAAFAFFANFFLQLRDQRFALLVDRGLGFFDRFYSQLLGVGYGALVVSKCLA